MTSAEIAAVVRSIGMEYEAYAEKIEAAGLNEATLKEYGDKLEELLDDLGVKNRLHRRRLSTELRRLLREDNEEAATEEKKTFSVVVAVPERLTISWVSKIVSSLSSEEDVCVFLYASLAREKATVARAIATREEALTLAREAFSDEKFEISDDEDIDFSDVLESVCDLATLQSKEIEAMIKHTTTEANHHGDEKVETTMHASASEDVTKAAWERYLEDIPIFGRLSTSERWYPVSRTVVHFLPTLSLHFPPSLTIPKVAAAREAKISYCFKKMNEYGCHLEAPFSYMQSENAFDVDTVTSKFPMLSDEELSIVEHVCLLVAEVRDAGLHFNFRPTMLKLLIGLEEQFKGLIEAVLDAKDRRWPIIRSRLLPDLDMKGFNIAAAVESMRKGERDIGKLVASLDIDSSSLVDIILKCVTIRERGKEFVWPPLPADTEAQLRVEAARIRDVLSSTFTDANNSDIYDYM